MIAQTIRRGGIIHPARFTEPTGAPVVILSVGFDGRDGGKYRSGNSDNQTAIGFGVVALP